MPIAVSKSRGCAESSDSTLESGLTWAKLPAPDRPSLWNDGIRNGFCFGVHESNGFFVPLNSFMVYPPEFPAQNESSFPDQFERR
jgi:hypothetical protein